ncbi:hypothetical protein EJB05_13189 [Eragrostis curvula]|uniref:F-box domain-containing protein n=1 Tax=Eragrostis curvula TaxID=38414 RepID=A0A5J9VXD3_9POAL|nr:hypothetical protein EJB05_13189 [Eragrostis curvula]
MDHSAPARKHGRGPVRPPGVVSSWQLRETAERRARAPAPPPNQGQPDLTASSVTAMEFAAPNSPSDQRILGPWRLRNTAARRASAAAHGQQAPTNRRQRRRRCGELNTDAMFDVLMRLPAKELCHLRAVCRRWRSLTTDNIFINLHAASHTGPLFLAKFRNDQEHIHVVDLSGTVVKTMVDTSAPAPHQVLFSRLSIACLATEWNRCRVLNPATGVVYVLPQSHALEHVNRVNLSSPFTFFALGRVASTGAYKVLRMFNRPGFMDQGEQLFEVFTINGDAAHAQWRARQSPEPFVEPKTGVVVDGVVHFLTTMKRQNMETPPDIIVSFDLGREEWMTGDLKGPISGDTEAVRSFHSNKHELSLAELKGSLVVACYHRHPCYRMELWFLTDREKGIWVKEYSVLFVQYPYYGAHVVKPLLVLDDGRLVIYNGQTGLLLLYNPETNEFAEVQMAPLDSVSMFTGSLLSVQGGDMV